MPKFLQDLLGGLSSGIQSLGDVPGLIAKAAKSVWHFAANIFGHVGGAWHDLWFGIRHLASALADLAQQLWRVAHWITNLHVPKSILNAVKRLSGWAGKEIGKAADSVAHLARSLFKHALGIIHGLYNFAHHAIRVLRTQVAGTLKWIGKVGNRTVDLVLHPARMVKWILADLVGPLLAFILNKAEAIVTALFPLIVKTGTRLFGEIEDELSKLL